MQIMKTQKGITIVALIITIIILLILAVVAIRAVQGEGIIVQATKSAFMSKAKKYEEELNLYINNKVLENINKGFDKSTLFANDITTPSIKEIIKSISKEDETKFVIREGKLEYIGEGTQELEWSKDLGIESKNKLKIYGNSVQDGTPTPDNPVEIQSVGDLVTDESDANSGKYKIPIKLTNESGKSEIKNIYLDEPLRKVGDYADYIDFNSGKVVRNIRKYIFNGTESWVGGFTTTNGWGGTNTVGFYQYVKGVNDQFLFGKYYPSKSSSTINNYFAIPKGGTYENDVQGSGYHGNNGYYAMRINRSILEQYGSNNSSEEVNQIAFAAFLKDKYDSGKPIEVQYVLEAPIENNITLPQITSLEDYTSIEVLTSIAPSKIEK